MHDAAAEPDLPFEAALEVAFRGLKPRGGSVLERIESLSGPQPRVHLDAAGLEASPSENVGAATLPVAPGIPRIRSTGWTNVSLRPP